jgi:hypothetical protein
MNCLLPIPVYNYGNWQVIEIAIQAFIDFAVDDPVGQVFGCKGEING